MKTIECFASNVAPRADLEGEESVGECNLRRLPDGSYLTRYADGSHELFRCVEGRIVGSGSIQSFDELFTTSFMRAVMSSRPVLGNEYEPAVRLMHALGYFVVPLALPSEKDASD